MSKINFFNSSFSSILILLIGVVLIHSGSMFSYVNIPFYDFGSSKNLYIVAYSLSLYELLFFKSISRTTQSRQSNTLLAKYSSFFFVILCTS